MYEKGIRVGALESINGNVARVFGFGVFEGSFDPVTGEEASSWFLGNPRIKLDDGKYVWGFECWWGPEDKIRQKIADMKIEPAEPQTNSLTPMAGEE